MLLNLGEYTRRNSRSPKNSSCSAAFTSCNCGRRSIVGSASTKPSADPIVKALLPHVQEAMKDKEPDDLLFSGPHGGRLVAANFRRAVDWAVIRTAVKRPDLRVHDLRHTFATILFDAGASAPDVQAVLGHSSLQVTERYSRAREGVARRTAAVFDTLTHDSEYGTNMAQRPDMPRL